MSREIAPSASQARLILIGTALLLALGMGIRQSFGLFLTPVFFVTIEMWLARHAPHPQEPAAFAASEELPSG